MKAEESELVEEELVEEELVEEELEEISAGLNPNPMEAFRLDGQVIVVTGGSRGLGRAMSVGLAIVGGTVVVAGRDIGALRETQRQVERNGGMARTECCDVSDENQVSEFARRVVDAYGRVDVVVNNAGIVYERPFRDMSPAEFRRTLEVNLVGTFLVSQAFGRFMIDSGGGRIVNIGSVEAVIGTPGLVAYCASKGGVVQLTRGLAAEWARYGVHVNCLCPGYFSTSINEERLANTETRGKVLSRIPMRRFGSPEELVPSVIYLASQASAFMTGQIVVIDGGESAL